jgi:hypothetical protein
VIKSKRIRREEHETLVRKTKSARIQGKRLLGRSRHTWEGNIKIDGREMGCKYVD